MKNPDVAHLTFRCMDKDLNADDFIAYASIPVSCLRTGWRCIQLFDSNSACKGDFEFAKLFVKVRVDVQGAERRKFTRKTEVDEEVASADINIDVESIVEHVDV